MKTIAIFLLTVISFAGYAQRVERFSDSLTSDLKRTWIDIDGSKFTELGENCNYGIEVTFIRADNQAIIHQCHEGEWKRFEYRFEVITVEEEHFIELFENEQKLEDYEFEVQMIADSTDTFITELTLFYYRDKKFYTLRSSK